MIADSVLVILLVIGLVGWLVDLETRVDCGLDQVEI